MDNNCFKLIEQYKKKLIEFTDIETRPDEMAVLDSILYRIWQMGWLPDVKGLDCDNADIYCEDCEHHRYVSWCENAIKNHREFDVAYQTGWGDGVDDGAEAVLKGLGLPEDTKYLVHCDECKHYIARNGQCTKYWSYKKPEGFCDSGEWADEEDDE